MILQRLKQDRQFRDNAISVSTAVWNIAYALGNLTLGWEQESFWFQAVGAYFLVLSVMRIGCLNALRVRTEKVKYIGRFIGVLLILLCLVLAGSVVLSHLLDVNTPIHPIIMIGIATFTTAKTTLAVINAVKAHKTGDPVWTALRNISCVDAAVSILSMQRSMLVSFGNMLPEHIQLMNLLTGMGVCVAVFAFGVALLRHGYPKKRK